ncbi:MAG: carboxypeptidase-like regulatory domain-containing protein, partial [Paludibacter sp.]
MKSNGLRVGLLSLFILLGSLIFAQNQKISLQIENATVKDLIKQIELKTDFTVVYRDVLIDDKKDITLNEENKLLIEILKSVLTPKGLQAVFNSKTIIITKKNAEPQVVNKSKVVSGVVLDEKGQPVIGASVIIPGTTIGVVTDVNGKFLLEAPINARLRISYIGYEPKMEELKANADMRISLEQTPKKLDELVVVGYGSQK